MTLRLLLDQNVPYQVLAWAKTNFPLLAVDHVQDLGLGRSTDREILAHAISVDAIVVTFDEDFADQRLFPLGTHSGVIRLRVLPTTAEAAIAALSSLFASTPLERLKNSLCIVDAQRIRLLQPSEFE